MTDRDLVRRDQADKFSTSPRGKNYLLAIAINDYQHCNKLSNAVRDVEAFIELMCTRYNFERENSTFIKDAAATKKGIENAFLRLIKTITPQDNLIVYFSGHGRYDEHYGGNWVPVEAGIAEEDWPDYLSNDSIKGYLGRIKSFHTFLIADSCFSGALFAERGKDKNLGQRIDTEPSRWALTSGKREIVSDGRSGGHSPFATALLDVLRKTVEPPSVMQICTLVLEKVAANAMQTPLGSALAVSGHQGGQMVLYFREDERSKASKTASTTPTLDKSIMESNQPKIKNSWLEIPEHMVYVEGGTFEMGDVMRDKAYNNETIHTVTLSNFMIGKHAVSFSEYDHFCETTYRKKPGDEDWGRSGHSVINVSWYDAVAYCNWRSNKEGLQQVYQINGEIVIPNWQANGYRLPTEAEWEYSARGGGKIVRFGNGKDIADPKEMNFYSREDAKKSYSLVGGWYRGETLWSEYNSSANALGLWAMSGNVFEWCWDYYGDYHEMPQKDPYGLGYGTQRVIRGGSWRSDPVNIRVAYRDYYEPNRRSNRIGFRLAMRQ